MNARQAREKWIAAIVLTTLGLFGLNVALLLWGLSAAGCGQEGVGLGDSVTMWWVGFAAGGSVVHLLHTLIGDWLKRKKAG